MVKRIGKKNLNADKKKKTDAITFWFFTLERLLEGGDVAESAQEEDDDVSLIFNGRYLQQQPQRRTCVSPITTNYAVQP